MKASATCTCCFIMSLMTICPRRHCTVVQIVVSKGKACTGRARVAPAGTRCDRSRELPENNREPLERTMPETKTEDKTPLIIALDFPDEASTLAMVDRLDPQLCRVK